MSMVKALDSNVLVSAYVALHWYCPDETYVGVVRVNTDVWNRISVIFHGFKGLILEHNVMTCFEHYQMYNWMYNYNSCKIKLYVIGLCTSEVGFYTWVSVVVL